MTIEIEKVELTSLDVKRFQKGDGATVSIRIDQNSTITRMIHLDEGRGLLSFRFSISYSGLGYINIEGDMVFRNGAQELVDCWCANGRIEPADANRIHNAVVSACLSSALLLSREVKLPPPFPLPRVSVQQPPPPGSGVEVA